MPNPNNKHDKSIINDLIEDAVVSHSQTQDRFLTLKLFGTHRTRIRRQRINDGGNPDLNGAIELPKLARGGRFKLNGVLGHPLQAQFRLQFGPGNGSLLFQRLPGRFQI